MFERDGRVLNVNKKEDFSHGSLTEACRKDVAYLLKSSGKRAG